MNIIWWYHSTVALIAAIFTVLYLRDSTGAWLGTVVGYMIVLPYLLAVVGFYAVCIVCFVLFLPIRIARELAEDLVDCGWPYWVAVTCSIPVGLLGMVVMFSTLL